MIIRGASFVSRLAVLFSFMLVFTACGGGGGGSGDGPFFNPPSDDIGIDISMYDAAGNQTNTISAGSPGTVRVFIRKGGANIVVNASTSRGVISPDSGLTDSNSRATFTLTAPPGTERGSGVVNVSATTEDGTLTATLTFEVGNSRLQIGHFDDNGDFIEGLIGISPDTTLSARGRAQLSVAVRDENGVLVSEPEAVLFSSGCLTSGLSVLDSENPLGTINGQVSTLYRAEGCSGVDNISAAVVGAQSQASGVLNIAPPEASGIVFVEADPTRISIQGAGGFSQRPESSDVFFNIVDPNGSPVQGVTVQFALSSEASGASLSPASAMSTSNGQVFTTVTSGDVGGVVRVIASIELEDGTQVSNISDAITISSGLPVQNNISLSVKTGEGFVVENGMTQDGVQRIVTVTMQDAFAQTVPNGTEARFETEFGTIDQTCRTGQQNGERLPPDEIPEEGKCSVLWTSSNPREPASAANQNAVQTTLSSNSSYNCPSHNGNSGACPDDLGFTRGGRSTVHVYALGEETFFDSNNDGVMNPDESDDFDNLPEAFLDKNEDDVFTPTLCDSGGGSTAQCRAGSEETFVDQNANGQYDLNNNPAVYNGFACPPMGDGVYCSREPLNVSADTVLILSAPDLGAGGDLWNITLTRGSTVVNTTQQGQSYVAYISDLYNNRPPQGSTVTVTANQSIGGCTVSPESTLTVGNSQSPGAYVLELSTGAAGISPEVDGTVTITLNPLEGGTVSRSFTCESLYCSTPAGQCDLACGPVDPNDPACP